MYGCKYLKMDMFRQAEYCERTGELTNADVKCDFGYTDCPKYIAAQRQEPKSAPKLTQTSIFGAAGEKPFRVG